MYIYLYVYNIHKNMNIYFYNIYLNINIYFMYVLLFLIYRVLKKTCPFRPCCGAFAFPEIAGTNKEICSKLVADLERDGPAVVMKTMDQPTKDAIRESLKGNREEAIRKRVSGDDDLSNKYLGNMKTMHLELTPPEDPSCTTLWFGNVEPDISEGDLREVIYPYGHIQGISMIAKAKCAFVQFASR
jgi:hypothetical protein